MFKKIRITINTKKAMNILSGSINITAGFIASIGINEIYKRVDKTDASKVQRYMMDCGARAVTIAACTSYIFTGVKELMKVHTDDEKLITIKRDDDIPAETSEEEPNSKGSEGDGAAPSFDPFAQKTLIINMLRELVNLYGDLHDVMDSLHDDGDGHVVFNLKSSNALITENPAWAEFVDALDVYYHHLDDMLPAGRAIYMLQGDLIRAVNEMISTES